MNVSEHASTWIDDGFRCLHRHCDLAAVARSSGSAFYMTKMLGIVDILVIIITLAISLAIVVPPYGIIVRFRANFNPKALRLDAEGGAQAHTGPVIKSIFAMAVRVYRLEVCFLRL